MTDNDSPYVSRGGVKLEHALREFGIDANGLVCADFGSHVGGFVDCLLQHGAARVFAVDPGHGVLDERLRRDERVIVHERTNAMKFVSPQRCDLLTVDVGWTQQRLILPAARRTIKPDGQVITLIKPHYEAPPNWLDHGVVPDQRLDEVLETCRSDVRELGWQICGETESPIRGHGGNREFLWHLRRMGRGLP